MTIGERNDLVEKHLYLARLVARTLASKLPAHVDVSEELEAEASMLLVEAADLFDASLGVPFTKWAKRYLFWRTMEKLRRRNLREATVEQIPDDYDRAAPATQEVEFDRARLQTRVRARVAALEPRDRAVIHLRYTKGLTMREVGRVIGSVGGSRASQVHAGILRELRRDWTLQELAPAA